MEAEGEEEEEEGGVGGELGRKEEEEEFCKCETQFRARGSLRFRVSP